MFQRIDKIARFQEFLLANGMIDKKDYDRNIAQVKESYDKPDYIPGYDDGEGPKTQEEEPNDLRE